MRDSLPQRHRPHYATGVALMLATAAYPFITAGGPANPVGCLAAGLILWASAARALVAR